MLMITRLFLAISVAIVAPATGADDRDEVRNGELVTRTEGRTDDFRLRDGYRTNRRASRVRAHCCVVHSRDHFDGDLRFNRDVSTTNPHGTASRVTVYAPTRHLDEVMRMQTRGLRVTTTSGEVTRNVDRASAMPRERQDDVVCNRRHQDRRKSRYTIMLREDSSPRVSDDCRSDRLSRNLGRLGLRRHTSRYFSARDFRSNVIARAPITGAYLPTGLRDLAGSLRLR